jgi:hypothetical protein
MTQPIIIANKIYQVTKQHYDIAPGTKVRAACISQADTGLTGEECWLVLLKIGDGARIVPASKLEKL